MTMCVTLSKVWVNTHTKHTYENKTLHHVQPTHTVDSSQLLASMTCGSVEEDYGPKYSVLSMLELSPVLSYVTEHCRQKKVSNMLKNTNEITKNKHNNANQIHIPGLSCAWSWSAPGSVHAPALNFAMVCYHGNGGWSGVVRIQSWLL